MIVEMIKLHSLLNRVHIKQRNKLIVNFSAQLLVNAQNILFAAKTAHA
jgi:hypothetical protein